MTQVILDEHSASRLYDISYTVELCDSSGRVLGRFVPASDLSEWEPMIPDATEDELDRREQSNEKRFSTAEVVARLEKLGSMGSGPVFRFETEKPGLTPGPDVAPGVLRMAPIDTRQRAA